MHTSMFAETLFCRRNAKPANERLSYPGLRYVYSNSVCIDHTSRLRGNKREPLESSLPLAT